jgi:glycosyltransferase
MKVTIITATLNAAATVGDCVRSVAEQAGIEIEQLILDGGSTDGTLAAVRSCGSPLVRIHAEADAGVYHAFNRGLALAAGDFVAFLNADDQYLPGALAAVAQAFTANPTVACIHGNIEVNGHICRPRRGLFSLGGARIYHPATFIRREALCQAGGFDTQFSIVADLDLFLRLRRRTSFLHLDQPLTRFALGGLSTRRFWRTQTEIRRVLLNNGYSQMAATGFVAADSIRSGLPVLCRRGMAIIRRPI